MFTGTLLRKITDDIQEHRAGKSPRDRKAFLFGAHEVNVAALAYALGTDEPRIPAYGSTIILETLRDRKGIYYVRVRYTRYVEQYAERAHDRPISLKAIQGKPDYRFSYTFLIFVV